MNFLPFNYSIPKPIFRPSPPLTEAEKEICRAETVIDDTKSYKFWSTKKIKQAQRELKKLWANPIIH